MNVSCTLNEKNGNVIHMRGKIIRKEKSDQYILYGCRSAEQNPEIMDYLKRLAGQRDENDNEQYMPK